MHQLVLFALVGANHTVLIYFSFIHINISRYQSFSENKLKKYVRTLKSSPAQIKQPPQPEL